jgi:cytochrome c oxidase subunit III
MAHETALSTTTAGGHAPAEPHASGGIGNPVLGMLLFIASEVMFFAGLFAAYFNIRANTTPWPPINPATNHAFELHIFPIVGPATLILIASSFTCQFGVWAIRRGDRTGLVRNIGITLVLGVIFLLMQGYDYVVLAGEGLTLGSGTYGTTFYTLTGFHGAHVFGGVIMLAVVLYRGMAGQFSARHHDAVEATSLYWHFVDVVWILLFLTLYIL